MQTSLPRRNKLKGKGLQHKTKIGENLTIVAYLRAHCNPFSNPKVNEEISKNQDVTVEFMTREQAAAIVDLSKLPEDASETLRIVRIGDYDACACIGAHVKNTSEIGTFKIFSHSFENGVWRLRWKVINQ